MNCVQIFRTFTLQNTCGCLANNYFKVNNRNIRKRCEIYLKLTIKTPERHYWPFCFFWLTFYCRFCFNYFSASCIKTDQDSYVYPCKVGRWFPFPDDTWYFLYYRWCCFCTKCLSIYYKKEDITYNTKKYHVSSEKGNHLPYSTVIT